MKTLSILLLSPILLSVTVVNSLKVAVVGTTGNVGRAVIQQLSKRGIPTRCLLRHDISKAPSSSKEKISASLASLDHVEMVKGDLTNPSSLLELVKGCDVIMALQGPPKPKNPLLSLLPFLSNPNAPYHSYTINYVGVQNLLDAARSSTSSVRRIVRLTGKGEEPFSIFSILINMLGYMAKGWNYEGEQLLRQQSEIEYTIVRPGLLMDATKYDKPTKARALKDNGKDMKVSPVTYDQIAELCVDSMSYDNLKRSTLTVMNVEENAGEERYDGLLEKVEEDQRYFEPSLIKQHRMGARLGFVCLSLFLSVILKGLLTFVALIL